MNTQVYSNDKNIKIVITANNGLQRKIILECKNQTSSKLIVTKITTNETPNMNWMNSIPKAWIEVPVEAKITKNGNSYFKTKSGNLCFVCDQEGEILKACSIKEYNNCKMESKESKVQLYKLINAEEKRTTFYAQKNYIKDLATF